MRLRPGPRPGRSAFWALCALVLAGCGSAGGHPALPAPGPPLRPGEARTLLARHAPELRYDRRERSFATTVDALTRFAVLRDARGRRIARRPPSGALGRGGPGAAGRGAAARGAALDGPSSGLSERGDVAYGHAVRDRTGRVFLQYWLFSTDNLQDRGVLRTGRHEGDWELVQLALDPRRSPTATTFAQHSWGEACAGGARVVWVAHGSHASYGAPGEHGRPWPDPDDEARGDGRRVRPRVVVLDGRTPSWVGWPGRWGGSRAARWPGENASPRGPAFQAAGQWRDPAGFQAHARACGSGAPPRPRAVTAAAAGLVLLGGLAIARRRRPGGGSARGLGQDGRVGGHLVPNPSPQRQTP